MEQRRLDRRFGDRSKPGGGTVRLVSAATTLSRPIGASDLVPSDPETWPELRGSLEQRREVRILGRRYRRDPTAELQSFEQSLIKQALPT